LQNWTACKYLSDEWPPPDFFKCALYLILKFSIWKPHEGGPSAEAQQSERYIVLWTYNPKTVTTMLVVMMMIIISFNSINVY